MGVQALLDREAVVDTLSSRITKDISDSLEHIDVHEVIGLLELIKMSLASQTLAITAKKMSDEIIGEETQH